LCPVRDPRSPSLAALRDAADPASLRLISCEVTDPLGLQAALEGQNADFLVSCLASRGGGILDSEAVEFRANHNLLGWARSAGVKHFTLLSAICVQKPRLAFQHAKLRFEQALASSGLSYSIVRPTAFFKSLSGQLDRVRAGKPFLVFGDGTLTSCKPIAESDLALFIRNTLSDHGQRGILPVGGPGPALSPLDQAALLASLLDRPVPVRRVPPGLLRAVATTLDVPGFLSSRIADKAEFARIGHYYATESMLLWDQERRCYDADATPEFGSITLRDSYRAQLSGDQTQKPGDHALFT
jgi:divinyl chlorophyllide a 8-vinyl-reductase